MNRLDDASEVPLAGGFDPMHPVVRVGDTIRRPPRHSSAAVRALLEHLEAVGFDGAPRHLGTDEQGRDVLSFVPGDVPVPSYPAWSMTDEVLTSCAQLLRRYHDAVASFDPSVVAGWELDWADPGGGPLVCHNDAFPENVVFREGRAVALIDFDMAGPGRPFWDVANALTEWAPLHSPDARPDHPDGLDAFARIGLFARAYGVAAADAVVFVDVLFEAGAHAIGNIRREVERGTRVWVDYWTKGGGAARADLDETWLTAQRAALIAAIAD